MIQRNFRTAPALRITKRSLGKCTANRVVHSGRAMGGLDTGGQLHCAALEHHRAALYNLYFASASNAVPIPANCSAATATCTSDDWPFVPGTWTSAMASAAGVSYWAPVPSNAPIYWTNGASPTVYLCPPSGVNASSTPTPASSALCPWTGAYAAQYPYYALPNSALPVVSSALTPYNSSNDDSWSLLDNGAS